MSVERESGARALQWKIKAIGQDRECLEMVTGARKGLLREGKSKPGFWDVPRREGSTTEGTRRYRQRPPLTTVFGVVIDQGYGNREEIKQKNSPKQYRSTSYQLSCREDKGLEDIEDTPGPNAYQVDIGTIEAEMKKGRGVSLKSRHYSKDFDEDIPGPGKYDVSFRDTKSSNGFSMSRGKRNELNLEAVRVPGPGTYSPGSEMKRRTGFTFGRTLCKSFEVDKNPGPGAYEVTKTVLDGPKFRFGTEGRFRGVGEVKEEGQNSLEPSYKLVKPSPVQVTMGTEPKLSLSMCSDRGVPGVGHYSFNLDTLSRRGVVFSKGRRFIRKQGIFRDCQS